MFGQRRGQGIGLSWPFSLILLLQICAEFGTNLCRAARREQEEKIAMLTSWLRLSRGCGLGSDWIISLGRSLELPSLPATRTGCSHGQMSSSSKGLLSDIPPRQRASELVNSDHGIPRDSFSFPKIESHTMNVGLKSRLLNH